MLKKTCLHCHDIGKIVDIAHLKIQPCVLIQMTLRVVLLRPEYRPNLHDTVKYADHHLLIELRTLGQNGRPVEIVEFKDVSPSFRSPGSDFGSMDFRKSSP